MKSKKWKVILKLFITIIIVAVIFQRIDYREIFQLEFFESKYFILAVLCIPIRLLVKSHRWQAIMNKAVPGISFIDSFKSMLVSISLGLITPMRLGQAGVVSYLESESNLKTGLFAYLEVILDLMLVIIASTVAVFFVFLGSADSSQQSASILNAGEPFGFNLLHLPRSFYLVVFLALAFVASVSIALITSPGPIFRLLSKGVGERLKERLSLLSEIKIYNKVELLKIIFDSIIIYSINTAQFFFLTYSFSKVPIRVVLISYPLIILGACLPITIAGLGAREGVAAWIYSSFGIKSAVGIKASFLLFVLNMVVPSIFGLLIYNLKGYGKRSRT